MFIKERSFSLVPTTASCSVRAINLMLFPKKIKIQVLFSSVMQPTGALSKKFGARLIKTVRELAKNCGAHFPKTAVWVRWKLWRARACQKLLRVPMKTMARTTKNYGVFCHKNGYVKRFYCLLSCVITKIINFAMCCPSCAPTKTLNLIQTAAWSRTSVFYHQTCFRREKKCGQSKNYYGSFSFQRLWNGCTKLRKLFVRYFFPSLFLFESCYFFLEKKKPNYSRLFWYLA